jgi:TolA-binding protein
MVDWLIEQAEKIQRYQESYSGLNKMYDHWRNKAKELEKQLQQAQAKVNELEQSLNDAAETAEQFLNDKHFYMDELKKSWS